MTLRFITKVETGCGKARVWYSFLLDALAPGGVRGATATGSILTNFISEEKKTRTIIPRYRLNTTRFNC